MSPEQFALEVLMGKSAFVAAEFHSRIGGVPENCLQDAREALEFEDPSSKSAGVFEDKHRGVLRPAGLHVEEVVHGDADGANKFGSEFQA